jgi:hypothetical protein
LQNDSEERRNLFDDSNYKPQGKQLSAELERWRVLTKDDRSEDGKPMQPCTNRMGAAPPSR